MVAADLADKCTIQLSYAIGVSHPLSVYVNTVVSDAPTRPRWAKFNAAMDLSPRGIRQHLGLNRPIARSAAYGHFGRVPERTAAFPGKKPI